MQRVKTLLNRLSTRNLGAKKDDPQFGDGAKSSVPERAPSVAVQEVPLRYPLYDPRFVRPKIEPDETTPARPTEKGIEGASVETVETPNYAEMEAPLLSGPEMPETLQQQMTIGVAAPDEGMQPMVLVLDETPDVKAKQSSAENLRSAEQAKRPAPPSTEDGPKSTQAAPKKKEQPPKSGGARAEPSSSSSTASKQTSPALASSKQDASTQSAPPKKDVATQAAQPAQTQPPSSYGGKAGKAPASVMLSPTGQEEDEDTIPPPSSPIAGDDAPPIAGPPYLDEATQTSRELRSSMFEWRGEESMTPIEKLRLASMMDQPGSTLSTADHTPREPAEMEKSPGIEQYQSPHRRRPRCFQRTRECLEQSPCPGAKECCLDNAVVDWSSIERAIDKLYQSRALGCAQPEHDRRRCNICRLLDVSDVPLFP